MKPIAVGMMCLVLAAFVGSAVQAEEFLYALSGCVNGSLVKIDPTTWTVLETHPITNDEALFGGLAADAAGDIYSIDGYNDGYSDRTFRIDRTNGTGTVVGDTGFNWNFRFVYAHPITDVLYGGRDSQLHTIDRGTGAATFLTNISGPTIDQVTAIAIDSQGNAYCTDIGNVGLFSLDLTTGQATHLGDLSSEYGPGFRDLAFDSNDVLYGTYYDGSGVYIIDIVNVTTIFVSAAPYQGLTFLQETECPGDIDGDGDTDHSDLGELLAAWCTHEGDPNWNPNADLDGDGHVGHGDLGILLADWGCGT